MALDLSPTAALFDLRRATQARRRAETQLEVEVQGQAAAIRTAYAANVAVTDLVAATGLSKPRIYQILDLKGSLPGQSDDRPSSMPPSGAARPRSDRTGSQVSG
jgi:hypothetical protein